MGRNIHGHEAPTGTRARYPGTAEIGIHWRRRDRSGSLRRIRMGRRRIRLPHPRCARAGGHDRGSGHDGGGLSDHGGRFEQLPRSGRRRADLYGRVEQRIDCDGGRIEHGRGNYHGHGPGRSDDLGDRGEPQRSERNAIIHRKGDRGSCARAGLERHGIRPHEHRPELVCAGGLRQRNHAVRVAAEGGGRKLRGGHARADGVRDQHCAGDDLPGHRTHGGNEVHVSGACAQRHRIARMVERGWRRASRRQGCAHCVLRRYGRGRLGQQYELEGRRPARRMVRRDDELRRASRATAARRE